MSAQPERHPFVHSLHRALVADVQRAVELALKVGVLTAAGYPRARMRRMLGVSDRDILMPLERLKRVAPELDRDAEL
jgi:hypothetical protein